MPQATDELRQWMKKYFNDPISDVGPINYLLERGYKLTKDWEWFLPFSIAYPSIKDNRCINFLIDEWDFGGLTLWPSTTTR